MGLSLRGQTSGAVDINAPAVAGDNTITLPDGNGSANQFYKNSTTAGIVTHSSMVELANGRVGIGTTNPARKFEVRDGSNSTKFSGSQIEFTRDNINYIQANGGSSSYLVIHTGGNNERVRINSSGGVGVNTVSIPSGVNVAVGGTIRVQDTTNSAQYLTINHQGINFQNTGAGSSTSVTAHTLDDYEEGTWTPDVSGGGVSWGNRIGRYTKVGNLVVVNYWLQASSTSSSSGTFEITGLPFALQTSDFRPTGAVRAYSLNNFSGKSGVMAWATNGGTSIVVVAIDGNGLAEGTSLNHNVWQNGSEIHCTFSYQTNE